MAINAKMLQYRGEYASFRPSALLPGQFAVVLSGDPNTTTGKAVYMCFETGKATRILADGDVVSGGGVSDAQIAEAVENYLANNPIEYELPVANENTLGGVKPVAKTSSMTQAVGVDEDGKLFTAPGGSGGSVSWNDILDKPFYEDVLFEYDSKKEYSVTIDAPAGEGATFTHFAKISDVTLTKDQLTGKAYSITTSQSGVETTQNAELISGEFVDMSTQSFVIVPLNVYVINEEVLDMQGVLTFTKGVWACHGWLGEYKVLSSKVSGEVKPIDEEFLPENVVKSVGEPTNILNVKIGYGETSSDRVLDKTFLEIRRAFYDGAYVIASWDNPMFFGAFQLAGMGDNYIHFVRMIAGNTGLVQNQTVSYMPTNDDVPYVGYEAFVLKSDDTTIWYGDKTRSTVKEDIWLLSDDGGLTYKFNNETDFNKWYNGHSYKVITFTWYGASAVSGNNIYKTFQHSGGDTYVCTYVDGDKWYIEQIDINSITDIAVRKTEIGGGGASYADAEGVAF